MGLESTQILDGIARSLLGVVMAFGAKDLTVVIENAGRVEVPVLDHQN